MTKLFNRAIDREKRKRLRNNATVAEKLLWSKLREKRLSGCRFRRQYSVKGFVLDFYSPQLKLAIEVDGLYHESENQKVYDEARERLIKSLGVDFLRFKNEEVENQITKVVERINDWISKQSLTNLPLTKGERKRG